MQIDRTMEAYLQIQLAAIAKAFKAPRITLVIRGPEEGNVKGDLVLTNDNPIFVERVFRAQMIERGKLLVGTSEEMDIICKEPTEGGKTPHFEDGGMAADYQPKRGKDGDHEGS